MDGGPHKLPLLELGRRHLHYDTESPLMQSRPIISATIRARDNDAGNSLRYVLTDIARRRGDIWITPGTDANQLVLGAMSESDLGAVCRILRAPKLNADIGDPKVIYVETIREDAEAESKYIRQTGGQGNYAHLKLRLEPKERGSGYLFVDDIKGGVIRTNYIAAIQAGIEQARRTGVLAGYEMVDFKAILYDGNYHDTDSNDAAFKIAASTAFKEAAQKANPILLEPSMALEVTTSQDYVDMIMRDLRQRRGEIQTAEHGLIRAIAPLAELLGYAKELELRTNGLAGCFMRFAHYADRPDGEQSGSDEAGIPVNNPKAPKPKYGSAHAEVEFE